MQLLIQKRNKWNIRKKNCKEKNHCWPIFKTEFGKQHRLTVNEKYLKYKKKSSLQYWDWEYVGKNIDLNRRQGTVCVS
jgi:hypothetical protein